MIHTNAFLFTCSFGLVLSVGGLFFGWLMRINPSLKNWYMCLYCNRLRKDGQYRLSHFATQKRH
ncbi:UNVERIFIED_CONTAM: hypothetical protein ABID48_001635 [Paenibacillus phyllosphaerae]